MMDSENKININGNDDKLLLGVGVPFTAAASSSKTNQVSVAQPQPPPFQDPAAALNNHQTFFATMQLPSSSSSSPAPGNFMNKDNNGACDLGELDQAFLLFLDAQAQDNPSSSHDQPQNYGMRPPNTLNIFPSQPMHVNPSSTAAAIAGLVISPDMAEASNRPSLPLMELSNLKNKAVVASASASEPPKPLKLEASGSRRGSTSSGNRDGNRTLDAKMLRRLAQNREAARRSRLRKKAYIQQLEESRITLIQLEQQLARARARGVRISENGSIVGAEHGHPLSMTKITPEGAAFDMEYARWVEEQHGITCELRNAVDENASEIELKRYVDACFAHYAKMTHLKSMLAKSDVLHLVSGMCWTPVERCFIWIGGFRPSQLLKVIMRQLELVTEQQVLGMIALQQSTQEAEEALSQGMEALHQTISDIISSDALLFYPSNLAACMGQMAAAITNLCSLDTFVRQADHLRTQTIQRLYQILTIRQVARCFLIIADYFHRLRALSSLWLGRPRQD